MKIIEELSGIFSGIFAVLSLSRGQNYIPIIFICLAIGIVISLLFSESLDFRSKIKQSVISFSIGLALSMLVYLLSPLASIWMAFISTFILNFYNFHKGKKIIS